MDGNTSMERKSQIQEAIGESLLFSPNNRHRHGREVKAGTQLPQSLHTISFNYKVVFAHVLCA